MSKRFVLVFMFFLLITISFAETPYRVIRSSSNGIEIQFELPSYQVKKTMDGYDYISTIESAWTIEPGKPELPVFSGVIAIPAIGGISGEFEANKTEKLSGLNILPYREDAEKTPIKDNTTYNRDAFYPTAQFSVSDPAIMRGQRLLSFSYSPFRFNPVTGELQVDTESKITFRYNTSVTGVNEVTSLRSGANQAFVNMWEQLVINPNDIRIRTEYDQPVLAYIVSSASVDDIQPLVDWKYQMGYDVVVATTTETGSNSDDIRDWILDAYTNWENPVDFVCLAGGTDDIPTIGNGDHDYALLEGGDEFEDIFIGRLSADNSAQLQVIVNKQLLYEKTPFTGTNWFDSVLLVGDTSPSGISTISTNMYVKERMSDYNPDYTFTEYMDASPSPANMDQAINAGVSFFNYRGYLGMSGWSQSNADGLNNGPKLPVFVIITCGTGGFGSGSRIEAVIRAGTVATPKGGVAAIGAATSSTHTAFNNCVDGGIFEGLFVEDMRTIGEGLCRGKANLVQNYGSSNSTQAAFFAEIISLAGDPSLQVWKGLPGTMTVNAPTAVAPHTGSIVISVTDESNQPLENAWVSITNGSAFQITDYTDNNGNAYLELDEATTTGQLLLTVSKPNYFAVQNNISYQANANGVEITSVTVDGGNNPLVAGSVGNVVFNLNNIGVNTLHNVTMNVSGEGFINLSGTQNMTGDLNSSATFSPSFNLNVDNTTFPDEGLYAYCAVNSNEGSWTFRKRLTVDSPLPVVDDITVITNNLHYIFLGQTEDIRINLDNLGDVDLNSFDFTLVSDDSRITVNSPVQTVASLPAGGSVDVVANITSGMNLVSGSMVPLVCQLNGANGFETEIPFLMQVGLSTETDPLGPDTYGYYIYDEEDYLYNLAPVYEWQEINTLGTNLNLNDTGNNEDCVTQVNLPFEFTFYGESYNQISVCSNGWISMGTTEQITFRNWRIPGANGPHAMIAGFWDDLQNGTVYSYFDSVNQTFIIEWDNWENEYNGDEETFQIILYNPDTYPSPTGDGSIKIQYQTFNNVNSQAGSSHGNYCSIGLMDHTGLVGLEYTFNNSYPTQATPLADGKSLYITTQNPLLMDPPIVGVSITNLSYQASVNQIITDQFEITNTGEADLRYRISKTYLTRNPEDYYSWGTSEDAGGPTFNWIDISLNGFDIDFTNDDEMSDPIALGFSFPYWDSTYNTVRVSANGFLTFNGYVAAYQNGEIPDDSDPNNIIAPFWDDFSPQMGAHVRFYPDSSHHRFIITYSDLPHYNTNDRVEFQVVLYENGRIDFQYNELSGNSESATVGIENSDGTEGIQLTYNEPFITEGLAVSFAPNLNWITIDPLSGAVPQNQSELINLTINTNDMAFGNFACNIEVSSNDPTQPIIIIPVSLEVQSDLPPMPPVLQVPLADVTFPEDTMYGGINLYHNFMDPNYDPLVFTVTGNEHINAIIVDGEVAFIPESNWSGTEELIFTADDMGARSGFRKGSRTTVVDTMLVTVTPVNDAPIAINVSPEETSFTVGDYVNVHFVYECFDPDSEINYTWRLNNSVQSGPDGNFTFDFNTGSQAAYSVVVQAQDEVNTLTTTWLVYIDETGNHEIVEVAKNELFQNIPNPFNPTTNIKFALKENGFARVAIYDARGRRVKTLHSGNLMHGIHTYTWDGTSDNGSSLASGVYFYRIESKEFTKTKKALMLK